LAAKKIKMKNQMIILVTILVLIAFAIENYMVFKLASQLSQFNVNLSELVNQQTVAPRFPTLILINPESGSDTFENRKESF